MAIQFNFLNDQQKQDLWDFENQHPNEVMLQTTLNAFEGEECIKMIIEAAGVIISIIELIMKLKKYSESKVPASAKKAEIIVIASDGRKKCILLENATYEELETSLRYAMPPKNET